MITPTERAEINRRNAQRSTGPREGKARSRFNAVKHGCRAKLPILPGEDPQIYQDRLDAWTGKFDPRDPVEAYLVERAVHASWQLDRADRAEVAELAEQMNREAARRAAEAAEVGARLFRLPGRPFASLPQKDGLYPEDTLISWPYDPDDRGYPAHLVAALEATAAGCCWLLEKWAALGTILEQGQTWQPADRVRAIRLGGKQPLDAIGDDGVLSIYLACQAMDPEGPDVIAEPLSDLHRPDLEASRQRLTGKFAKARAERSPRDAEAARAALQAVVAAAMARVWALREVREASEAADRADIMARLPHSASRSLEWLHKHQVTCSRSLYRAIEELRKVRRDFDSPDCPSSAVRGPLLADDDARIVTNEATAPAEPTPVTTGDGPRTTDETNEATAPDEPPPVMTDDGERTADETNEATAPAEPVFLATDQGQRTADNTNEATVPAGAARSRPVLPAVVVALLVGAGLIAAFAVSVQARDPSPVTPRHQGSRVMPTSWTGAERIGSEVGQAVQPDTDPIGTDQCQAGKPDLHRSAWPGRRDIPRCPYRGCHG